MRQGRFHACIIIEIVVVIAIIAVSTAFLMHHNVRANQQAQLAACKQNLQKISFAIQMYRVRTPSDRQTARDAVGQRITINSLLITQGFLGTVPRCPTSNSEYVWAEYLDSSQETIFDQIYHADLNCHTKVLGPTGHSPRYCSRHGGIIERD